MRMQLTIHAASLKNAAGRFGGKSDPYAVVEITGGPKAGTKMGRTETIKNSLSPEFCKILFVDSDPAVIMPFRVSIFDDNNGRTDKLMCEANFADLYSVYECVGDSEVPKHMQFVEVAGDGRIYVHLEKSAQGNQKGHFGLKLRGLDMKNVETGMLGLGRSDPFFEVAKKNADPDNGIVRWNTVYRSDPVIDNLNPFWDKVAWITLEELCYCDTAWPLKIVVNDWQQNGKHRLIGQVETTIAELQQRKAKNNGDRESAFVLTKEGKEKRKGLLVVIDADLRLEE